MSNGMDRKPGDRVSVDDPQYPGVWIIRKTNPVNAVLEPENGGRSLRAPYGLLIDPTTAPASFVPTEYYEPGEFVRIIEGRYVGLWVVIADRRADMLNVAKPGGDGGRYLRVKRRGLVRVPAQDVLK